MMGNSDKPQGELFYASNLEEIVPQDHLLRDIDRLLDFTELREHLAPYYSHTGRPSVDPELMIRILYRCWKTRTPYDEARYLKALQERGSPLLKMSEAA